MDYLENIITTDETWIYCYNPMFKKQKSKWVPRGSFCSLKPSGMKPKMKCVVITFFNRESLVYTHAVLDDQTVNVDWHVGSPEAA